MPLGAVEWTRLALCRSVARAIGRLDATSETTFFPSGTARGDQLAALIYEPYRSQAAEQEAVDIPAIRGVAGRFFAQTPAIGDNFAANVKVETIFRAEEALPVVVLREQQGGGILTAYGGRPRSIGVEIQTRAEQWGQLEDLDRFFLDELSEGLPKDRRLISTGTWADAPETDLAETAEAEVAWRERLIEVRYWDW